MQESIASPRVISYQKILEQDEAESTALFEICCSSGIFYLDLSSNVSLRLDVVDALFDVGRKFFDLDLNRKLEISRDKLGSYMGYKPTEYNVVDPDGTPDQNEVLNISKDELLKMRDEETPYPGLNAFTGEMTAAMKTFTLEAHNILCIILAHLSKHLRLQAYDDLPALHRLEQTSEDHIRLIKYTYTASEEERCELMLEPHTDFGSLTLLFTDRRGLQILDVDSGVWQWIEPRRHSAVVNVGDALVKFTNGLFRSIQHRVVNPFEGHGSKYSLGYFLRPSSHLLLRALSSPLIVSPDEETPISSKDWQDARVLSSKIGHFKGKDDWHNMRGTAVVWEEQK